LYNEGTTVTSTNNDATLYTVVSGTADPGLSGVFESPIMAKGATFQHTFDTAETFDYYCTLHAFMIAHR
jgi:plastocyanin